MNYSSILGYREIAIRKTEKRPIKKKYFGGVGLSSFLPIGKRGGALELEGRMPNCSALISWFFPGYFRDVSYGRSATMGEGEGRGAALGMVPKHRKAQPLPTEPKARNPVGAQP